MEYKIVRQVGYGSNTKVFEAFTTTGERFALKILNPISNSLSSEKYLQKKIDLLHEVEVGQKLHHPLIIAPIDGGENEIGVYCVLPYFDTNPSTPNLAKLYPVGTIISPNKVSEVISTIATALQYCHDQGVIHADVKPNNILVGKNDQLKLADFGISVIVGGNDRVSKGPTHFSSPEQNRGEICFHSDQYSLACISYLLLTGQHIFEHEDKQQLRNMHINAVPELKNLSPNIEKVLSRALSKSSLQRFNSILEYSQNLSETLRI